MGRIARMIKTEIENFIVQTVEMYFGANVTAETFAPSGDDSPPLPEDRIVLVQTDGTNNFVAVGVLSVSQGAKPGEKILYSRDESGEVKAAIKLLNDGKIEMVSPADFSFSVEGDIKVLGKGDASIMLESGKMEVGNSTATLGAMVSDLLDALSDSAPVTYGSPASHSFLPSFTAKISAIKAKWGQVFE